MKKPFRFFIAVAGVLACLQFASVQAVTYTDAINDGALVGTGGGILDISSAEISNDSTTLTFKINLVGDPTVTDWGKYTIGLVTGPGGDPAGNGWGRPIRMSFGMNYWVGSWADSGNGAELRKWAGSAWSLQSATYNPNPDLIAISKDSASVTLHFNFSGIGLKLGDSFLFDVYTTGGGGSDGAIDALANPLQTIANWSDPYDSGVRMLPYTLVPEPSVFALLSVGAVVLINRARRR